MHRKNPNRKFSLRFGKAETGSEEKRLREQRGLVPSRPVLTCLRRPYLFSRKRKDREEKSAWMRLVLSASDFRRAPMFWASFHSILTSRASDYAPPDTEVSSLQLVASERLPSIEGAVEIQMDVTFLREPCRGGTLLRPKSFWSLSAISYRGNDPEKPHLQISDKCPSLDAASIIAYPASKKQPYLSSTG